MNEQPHLAKCMNYRLKHIYKNKQKLDSIAPKHKPEEVDLPTLISKKNCELSKGNANSTMLFLLKMQDIIISKSADS